MGNIFEIDKFNVIEDEENYYFFRALNMADNQDIETGKILDEAGQVERIRTDRERYEENPDNETPKYDVNSGISLEQVYDHIKMHYRKDTNCISLSSNSNVSISYGRGFYKDKYIMVKIPKKELGEKVINAGQYMLEEIEKKVDDYISSINPDSQDSQIVETLAEIDNSKTADEIRKAIQTRYTSKEEPNTSKAKLKKGITYRSPVARISSYQALNEEQSLEKNKIIAKLTLLERVGGMKPIIPHTVNNNLLVQTIGNAFSSLELIHYGDIPRENIINLPKEMVDIFALLQQVDGQDQQVVKDLEREVIQFVNEGRSPEISENSILLKDYGIRDNISIEEMYELTNGKVEYGMANSIVKNMFYLAKSQAEAKEFAKILSSMVGDNPKYSEIIQYISDNGFRVEPEIITRQSNKGIKLSESISLDLKDEEVQLIDKIKDLSEEEQLEIIKNGGLSNIRNIMSDTFSRTQRDETISKKEYYAEAIFSLYDWQKIGIEEFTATERNNLIQRIQNEYCIELYKKLENQGIEKGDISTVLLNMITRKNDYEITEQDTPETIKAKRLEQYDRILAENIEDLKQGNNVSDLKQDLSIERIERFLGYYDVSGTGIQLRPYQQRATEKVDEILQDNRFASVILPTGAGKSFVALSQLMEHKNEEILYIAPQNEILEQMKDYIIKYIHGPVNTLGRSKGEIIADVFPNLKFSTYPGLLARDGKETINKQYGFVVLDELHRTGAKEWGEKLNTLLDNQTESTKVLGITATPRRDADGINMANEMAGRLGYTNREAVAGKHVAMNMSLTNAIRMDLVVNPKLVSCAYSLKEDGSLDELKGRIDQIEDIQEKNEKLEEYESLRRNVEDAEGIPEILQANVKKGGKYIVFLPIVEDLEDEDGNVIGRKKGKDKIKDYEKQIAEYFKDSDITPHFHSMLGEYGDKENSKRLEEFQNTNTDDTEFMLVMNKANEGLHLDKLDGMIWLRPMDENSRILYLQQLGRVIYSEDPDNPTKDEDRPVVIDLVNNTLKVNWENEITEQDDIQMLNIIVDWTERHDGTLPNINSSDKEETGYATVLKEIQTKYKGYLERGFEELTEKQIEEVQEILKLGSLIDLWQSELPDKIAKNGGKGEGRGFTNKNAGPFELTGLIKDFVELEDETGEIDNRTAVERFIGTLEKLKDIRIDVSKLTTVDTIQTLAKKSGISEEQLTEIGLNPKDKIGSSKSCITQAYRGKRTTIPPTQKQVERLKELGIDLEERNITQKFIEKLEKLQDIGVDVSKLTTVDTIQTLAQKSGISEEQLTEIGLNPKDKIGSSKSCKAQAYRGKRTTTPPTQEQVERLKELGIDLEERNIIQKFIEKLEKLQDIGVDVSKLITVDTIQTLAKKSGISEEQLTEIGLNPKDKIGNNKTNIAQAYKGKRDYKTPTKEQVERLKELGINLEERNVTQEFIEKLEKLQDIGVDVSKITQRDTIQTLAQKSEISEEQLTEIGLNPKDKIGISKSCITQTYRSKVKGKSKRRGTPPSKEQVERLQELGINLERRRRTGKEIAQASISSLTDIEMSDREDAALKELVEKTKEGGIKLDEQS